MPGKECNPNAEKANNNDYICNPVSGRWVKKNGAAGRRIIQNAANRLHAAGPPLPVYGPAPAPMNNPPANAQPVGMGDFMQMLMGGDEMYNPRADGFLPKDNIPENPEIVYIEKDTGFVWAKDIFNELKNVKNNKLKHEEWKPICKLIPKKDLKYYQYPDLTKIANKCKIPKNDKKPRRTKRALYNLIDWNQRGKCSNEFTFMGDAIGDIPAIKIIRLNDVCYNIDDVVQNLISTEGKNVDMYNSNLKYWKTEEELDDIIVTHKGLDPELKKKYKDINVKKLENLKKVFKSKDTSTILGNMARAGWAAASDNPFNHDHDPGVFQMSQKSLGKLISSVNKSKNKEIWLNIISPQGVILGDIIKDLSNMCVHGVGFKLMGLYIYLIGMSRRLKVSIKLSDLFIEQVKDREYVTFDIYTKGGSGDKLSEPGYNKDFRYVMALMQEGKASRVNTDVNNTDVYSEFLKAGIKAQKMIKKEIS